MGGIEPPQSRQARYFPGPEGPGRSTAFASPPRDKTGLRFNLNSGSSLLKWLNSLYRPAWPEGIHRTAVLPLSDQAIGASPSGKAVDFDSTMRRFESSRPSQPVRRLEKMSLVLAERPANGGLLRISHQSLGSNFRHSQREIADSLGRTFEIFPFLGDCDRRLGSIRTAWPGLHCKAPHSPPRSPANCCRGLQPLFVIGSTSIPKPWPMTHHSRLPLVRYRVPKIARHAALSHMSDYDLENQSRRCYFRLCEP
jgi:hypothetical protein